MTIDVKRIQPGDEVWLKGVVADNDGGDVRPIKVFFDGEPNWVGMGEIIQHIPRAPAISKGDFVRWRGAPGDKTVRVIAIDGDEAWVEGSRGRFTAHMSDLERVS